MIDKNLQHDDICRVIVDAQEIIGNLHEQNNIEIKESYYLQKAFDDLQEVFETQFAKSCKPLIKKIVNELLGDDEK